jgi:hypothetical protein
LDKVELINALELSFFDFGVRHSIDKLNELIADNFVEYGRSGKVLNKKDIISLLLNTEPPAAKLENFKIKNLSDDFLLVNYISIINKKDKLAEKTLRTSIWKLYGEKWKVIFHQGTPTEI